MATIGYWPGYWPEYWLKYWPEYGVPLPLGDIQCILCLSRSKKLSGMALNSITSKSVAVTRLGREKALLTSESLPLLSVEAVDLIGQHDVAGWESKRLTLDHTGQAKPYIRRGRTMDIIIAGRKAVERKGKPICPQQL